MNMTCVQYACMYVCVYSVRIHVCVFALANIMHYEVDVAYISSSFKNELPEDLPGQLPLLLWSMLQKDQH